MSKSALNPNSSEISIRRATVQDAPMLSQFAAQLFKATFGGTCTDSDMETQLNRFYNLQQVTSELADTQDYFHLMCLGGKAVGYSRLREGNAPASVTVGKRAIELKRLYFSSAVHGRGFAAELLRFNLELAWEMKYERVYLSVWEFNHRAKAFYAKMGFVDTKIANPFPIGETPQMDYWYAMDLATQDFA